MNMIWKDLRFGWRQTVKSPGFATTAIAILGVGIATNAVIFSMVNGLLLRPFPYPDADRLVRVYGSNLERDVRQANLSLPDFRDMEAQTEVFSELAAFYPRSFNLSGGEIPARVSGGEATADVFSLGGRGTLYGRPFTREEVEASAQVAVLSHGLWQRSFGSDPNVVGAAIRLDGQPFTIVGVQGPESQFQDDAEVIIPLQTSNVEAERDDRSYRVFARLAPRTDLAQANSALAILAERLARQFPEQDGGWTLAAMTLRESRVGEYKALVAILWVAVFLLLMLVCANVANLLLHRALAREREMGLRTALGASRSRLVRQLLAEGLVLAFGGCAAGLLLTLAGVRALPALIPFDLPTWLSFQVDWRVLAFIVLLGFVVTVLFGLAPALRSSRVDLRAVLTEGDSRAGGSLRRRRLRSAMLVAQIALSLVLLISAGLMVRSFRHLQKVDPGFTTEGILTATLALPESQYPEEHQRVTFFDALLDRVSALPGVEGAALARLVPLDGWSFTQARVEGQAVEDPERRPWIGVQTVAGSYFEVLGIPLLRGSSFDSDFSRDPAPEVVVGKRLADRLWPDEDPIGQRIRLDFLEDEGWLQVVGVVPDVRRSELGQEASLDLYLPYGLRRGRTMRVFLRTSGNPLSAVSAVRREVQTLDPNLPLDEVRTLQQVLQESLWLQRLTGALFALFGVVALLLAAVGLYGSTTYSVFQRIPEIGVRMALGARGADVRRMVVVQGLKTVLVGALIGVVAAVGMTAALGSFLYGVAATDPLTISGIVILLLVVASLAAYLPARMASRVDPGATLRYE